MRIASQQQRIAAQRGARIAATTASATRREASDKQHKGDDAIK